MVSRPSPNTVIHPVGGGRGEDTVIEGYGCLMIQEL